MNPSHQVEEAMARLDDETRALLELSSQRQVSDAELADLLRLDQEEVAERRRRAQQRLNLELGLVPDAPGEDHSEKPGRRRWIAAAVAGLVVATVVAIVLGTSGGDDSSGKSRQAASPAPSKPSEQKQQSGGTPAPARKGPVRTMQVLNQTHGRGTAQLVGGRLRLRLSGFLTPNGGGYAVWLFNSQGDARLLYATADTTISTDLELPRGYDRYRYVDVARAVPALRSPHSGLSLLRVPVAQLR